MLLLVGRAGLLPWARCPRFASVSFRLKLGNFEGGGGLEPEGREYSLFRRSRRYWAVKAFCELASSSMKLRLSFEGQFGV